MLPGLYYNVTGKWSQDISDCTVIERPSLSNIFVDMDGVVLNVVLQG